jgi:hypothetical protein
MLMIDRVPSKCAAYALQRSISKPALASAVAWQNPGAAKAACMYGAYCFKLAERSLPEGPVGIAERGSEHRVLLAIVSLSADGNSSSTSST